MLLKVSLPLLVKMEECRGIRQQGNYGMEKKQGCRTMATAWSLWIWLELGGNAVCRVVWWQLVTDIHTIHNVSQSLPSSQRHWGCEDAFRRCLHFPSLGSSFVRFSWWLLVLEVFTIHLTLSSVSNGFNRIPLDWYELFWPFLMLNFFSYRCCQCLDVCFSLVSALPSRVTQGAAHVSGTQIPSSGPFCQNPASLHQRYTYTVYVSCCLMEICVS